MYIRLKQNHMPLLRLWGDLNQNCDKLAEQQQGVINKQFDIVERPEEMPVVFATDSFLVYKIYPQKCILTIKTPRNIFTRLSCDRPRTFDFVFAPGPPEP